jgi:plastocyanin
MKRILAVAGITSALALGAVALSSAAVAPPNTKHVQVHCPTGNGGGFVTPAVLHISVGDSVQWNTTGQVTTTSLAIALKDTAQAWPFTGALPQGATSATAARALRTGTYGYSVTMECRTSGGGSQHVVIDPDIIIE